MTLPRPPTAPPPIASRSPPTRNTAHGLWRAGWPSGGGGGSGGGKVHKDLASANGMGPRPVGERAWHAPNHLRRDRDGPPRACTGIRIRIRIRIIFHISIARCTGLGLDPIKSTPAHLQPPAGIDALELGCGCAVPPYKKGKEKVQTTSRIKRAPHVAASLHRASSSSSTIGSPSKLDEFFFVFLSLWFPWTLRPRLRSSI